jgi:hypothetical protein
MPDDSFPEAPAGLHCPIGIDPPQSVLDRGNRLGELRLKHVFIVRDRECGVHELIEM